MNRTPALGLGLCVLGAVSCGYYNGMWSADRFAAQARRQERDGRQGEARASWAAAAVKAESVVAHHPHGRWADAALVLHGEALARSGSCDRAAAPLARALASVEEAALRERAALAAAECNLDARKTSAAAQLLHPVSASTDRARASRAAYLSGRVAEQRGDPVAAADWYAQSSDPQAGPARARALLAAGRTDAALAFIDDTLVGGRFDEAVWAVLLGAVGDAAGAMEATRLLDHVLGTGHVLTGARARLALADGNRLLAVDSLAPADARYQQVAAMVPDSSEAQVAIVRRLRVNAAQTASLAELRVVQGRVDRVVQLGIAGAALNEAQTLQQLIESVMDPGDSGQALPFRSAELARDSLRAPHLAAVLFLAFASSHPASLFAPKALIAAAALSVERRDSLLGVLDSAYATSPYTLALRGEHSPAYAAAEDSLARALGGALDSPAVFAVSLVAPPVPGPRGPALEPGERSSVRGRSPALGEDAAPRDDWRGPPSKRP